MCLAGRPNVGKSTLLNALVGQKVAVVTRVPGTTRNAIRGIVTRDDGQVVFVDTPGLTKPQTLLGRRLNQLARSTWGDVDLVCFLVDAQAGIGRGDQHFAREIAAASRPAICVVNKQDAAKRGPMLQALERATELGDWLEIVPISAKTGANVGHLLDVIVSHLPEGPPLYPADAVTDQDDRQRAAEILREKFISRAFEEVPHSIAVVIEEFGPSDDRDDLLEVQATVYVERESQKAIVIGKGGALLRDANTAARVELEGLFGSKVFLDVRVKVAKEWQRDVKKLQRFGY